MKKLLLLLIMLPLAISAQKSKTGNWWAYIGNAKIASKLNWHHEVQYRNYNFIGDTEQLLLRTGLGYNLTPNNNNVLIGYGFIQSQPYIDDEKTTIDEHRVFQQYIFKHKWSQLAFTHRFRSEQRFIETDFKFRFRYSLGLKVPLGKNTTSYPSSFYAAISNEIFVHTTAAFFDRNRIYGGIGYRFSKHISTEVGLMNQTTTERSRNQATIITFISL